MSVMVTRFCLIFRFEEMLFENANLASGDALIALALRMVRKGCFKGNLTKIISAVVGRLVGSQEGWEVGCELGLLLGVLLGCPLGFLLG